MKGQPLTKGMRYQMTRKKFNVGEVGCYNKEDSGH